MSLFQVTPASSRHLAAAIAGHSTLTIQGTAGTTEEHIKHLRSAMDVKKEEKSDSKR